MSSIEELPRRIVNSVFSVIIILIILKVSDIILGAVVDTSILKDGAIIAILLTAVLNLSGILDYIELAHHVLNGIKR